MNREEFIGKLQMVYIGDRNAFNEIVEKHEELVSYACDLEDEICNLKGENQRLNNVLNELEKLTISICENCYEDRETERIKKRINELKESDK